MAPVVREMRRYDAVRTLLISTGQHKEILLDALATFDLTPDMDLEIMQPGQSLADVTARAVSGLGALVAELKPEALLAQGDTTTTFASALVAFYAKVAFGHVEAGLRTDSVHNPFPEEFNRRATSLVSALHFAPTRWAADNLLREGCDPASVVVTGNTGIDAVLGLPREQAARWAPDHAGRVLLLTTHRRENWGEPQRQIARAARRIVDAAADTLMFVPMHPNPDVRADLVAVLGGHERIHLIEPQDYRDFVALMRRSALILSDSGGVQEEAPSLGVPVLVLRDTTERPEGVSAGVAKLVGTDEERIFTEGTMLLNDEAGYRKMAHAVSPYGDGRAAERVRYAMLERMGIESPEAPQWAS